MQDRFFISAALREIGRRLAVKGENPFKARAYERAARALEALQGDLAPLIKERCLTQIPGVGNALAAVIEELYATGSSYALERLREELPPGVLELSDIPGLSLKKIVALHAALGIEKVSELQLACETGQLRKVKGFGAKSEAKILDAIKAAETKVDRIPLAEALKESDRLLSFLRSAPSVIEAGTVGDLRRSLEMIPGIELLVASEEPEPVVEHFMSFPALADVRETSVRACTGKLAGGIKVDLIVVPPGEYTTSLHYLTGSTAHIAKLEKISRSKGITFGPEGLRTTTGNKLRVKKEEEIYGYLGMQYVPPELREDEGEVEAALHGDLPRPVALEEIQGLIHCHTVYSDGTNTIEEMAVAADEIGARYLTITDHSPSAYYARGVQIDRLRAQWDEIASVQEKVKVKLLRGTESDILDDGSLDYPDYILEKFDVIIASIHTRSGMEPDAMTNRLVRAMKSPFFKIWGHPLGRLVRSRPPLACHMEEVLDAIASSAAAIEVNGDPRRLDLEPRWIREARRRGIKFVVSTDAHSTASLRYLQYGVAMARRGWLTRDEILNTMNAEDFMKAVRPR